MAAPRAVRIELSEAERGELEARLRRRKVARGDALRAQIVLLAAEGLSNLAIVERLGVACMTVALWRRRFAERRMDGLAEEPRPGAPRSVSDEKVAEVVTETLETLPAGRTHWSSRGMARAAGLAPSTVQRIWKAFSLQPPARRREEPDPGPRPYAAAAAAASRPGRAAHPRLQALRHDLAVRRARRGGRHRHRHVHAAAQGNGVPVGAVPRPSARSRPACRRTSTSTW